MKILKHVLIVLSMLFVITFIMLNAVDADSIFDIRTKALTLLGSVLPSSIEEFVISVEETPLDDNESGDVPTRDPSNPSDGSPTIYVDPGHGGDANNGTTAGGSFLDGSGLSEETNNFQIAVKVQTLLKKAGYNVKMSREQAGIHNAISNSARGKEAVQYAAIVCIHSNGTGNHEAYGCFNVVDKRYGYNHKMGDIFLQAMKDNGRNVAYGGYYNRDSLAVSGSYVANGGNINNMLYVEVGAHDNPNDWTYIQSDQGREQIAECIVKAISSQVPLNTQNPTPSTDSSEIQKEWDARVPAKGGPYWSQLSESDKAAAKAHWDHMVAEGKPGYTGW